MNLFYLLIFTFFSISVDAQTVSIKQSPQHSINTHTQPLEDIVTNLRDNVLPNLDAQIQESEKRLDDVKSVYDEIKVCNDQGRAYKKDSGCVDIKVEDSASGRLSYKDLPSGVLVGFCYVSRKRDHRFPSGWVSLGKGRRLTAKEESVAKFHPIYGSLDKSCDCIEGFTPVLIAKTGLEMIYAHKWGGVEYLTGMSASSCAKNRE